MNIITISATTALREKEKKMNMKIETMGARTPILQRPGGYAHPFCRENIFLTSIFRYIILLIFDEFDGTIWNNNAETTYAPWTPIV